MSKDATIRRIQRNRENTTVHTHVIAELKIPFGKYSGSGEVLLRIVGGWVRPGSRNSDPISDPNMSFCGTLFQTWFLVSIPVSYLRPKRLENDTV